MILYIDTSKGDSFTVALVKATDSFISQEIKSDFRQAELLLPTVDQLLNTNGQELSSLQGIIVVSGPGSFTALRTGVILANTLAYALKLPVIGIRNDSSDNLNKLIAQGLEQLTKAQPGTIVVPEYGQEPNITIKKQ